MKKFIAIICSLLILTVSSCKKELEINVKKTYVEKGAMATTLGFSGVMLTLMPDGKADVLFGGDMMMRYNYTIKGKTILLTGDNGSIKVKVISETQLLYENDRILILSEN
ncbi:hypothetical protein [Pedobacter frigiditerrae]|uniref:hypothetical protein n=1 Tax=Pedobacter frigiditerrae TaxID=2530452 RepID=UPI00292F87A2|nr:hypothetical protein [Pedobacter frigiditerrae]